MFGDLSRTAMFGDRRTIEMMIDQSRYIEFRKILFQATPRFDIVIDDTGSATVAGPMVGLYGGT